MNVATFYRFVALDDPHALAARLRDLATQHELRGTILLAREGINATLTGDGGALVLRRTTRTRSAFRASARAFLARRPGQSDLLSAEGAGARAN